MRTTIFHSNAKPPLRGGLEQTMPIGERVLRARSRITCIFTSRVTTDIAYGLEQDSCATVQSAPQPGKPVGISQFTLYTSSDLSSFERSHASYAF